MNEPKYRSISDINIEVHVKLLTNLNIDKASGSDNIATIYSVQRYIKFFMVGDSSLCCQQNVMTFD